MRVELGGLSWVSRQPDAKKKNMCVDMYDMHQAKQK
jgi:hypothetical protein